MDSKEDYKEDVVTEGHRYDIDDLFVRVMLALGLLGSAFCLAQLIMMCGRIMANG